MALPALQVVVSDQVVSHLAGSVSLVTPAGIYLRVSTDQQNTEVQLPALERMAAARGYAVTEIYRDAAIGGTKTKMERPELARLFKDAARGSIRAAFVWALDRFSRDDTFTGGLLMVGELDHYRCALLSHEETWMDTSGMFREPLVALSLKMAASERSRLIRRTNEGIAYARAHGTKSGKAIGRPRVAMSDAMLDRALSLRAGRGAFAEVLPRPWRVVARMLESEGFTVPTAEGGVKRAPHGTLQRLATSRDVSRRRARFGGWPKPPREVVPGAGRKNGGIA